MTCNTFVLGDINDCMKESAAEKAICFDHLKNKSGSNVSRTWID